jgi:ferredoxin
MSEEKKTYLKDIWDDLTDEQKKQIEEIKNKRDERLASLESLKKERDLAGSEIYEYVALRSLWIPYINKGKCSGCEDCIGACPRGAILMNGDTADINYSLCYPWNVAYCNPPACVGACPEDAITVVYL